MSPNQQPVIQPDMYHPPDGTHPKVRQQQQHQPKMLMLMMIMAKTNTTTMSYMLIIFSVYEKRKMTNKRMNIKLHNYEEIERENICVNKPLRQSKKKRFLFSFLYRVSSTHKKHSRIQQQQQQKIKHDVKLLHIIVTTDNNNNNNNNN
mmetsp:Transcript_14529/g.15701  ORF Transcript_14529/g.15701 Transcript_14529/m.15701 type:complete len:148 (-) Transcript_14529:99-542(-)